MGKTMDETRVQKGKKTLEVIAFLNRLKDKSEIKVFDKRGRDIDQEQIRDRIIYIIQDVETGDNYVFSCKSEGSMFDSDGYNTIFHDSNFDQGDGLSDVDSIRMWLGEHGQIHQSMMVSRTHIHYSDPDSYGGIENPSGYMTISGKAGKLIGKIREFVQK